MRPARRGLAAALFAAGLGLLWPAPAATPGAASAGVAASVAASAPAPVPAPASVPRVMPASLPASAAVAVPAAAPAGAPLAVVTVVASAPAAPSCAVAPGQPVPDQCMADADPLSFEKTAVTTLPAAVENLPYTYRFRATGGEPPYVFRAADNGLPEGLTLDAAGNVNGATARRGRHTFLVELRDRWGQGVRQRFALNVVGPRAPSPARPASTPAADPPIQTVPIAATQTPLRGRTLIDTWRLTEAVLGKIAPPAAPPAPEGEAEGEGAGASAPPAPPAPDPDGLDELSEAGASQLATLLQPLINVEYPTRALFTAALDARVCTYAAELTAKVALETGKAAPGAAQWRERCLTAWQGPPPKTPPQLAETPVKWQDLPATLLPPRVRAWLVEQAMTTHDAAKAIAPGWSGTGCNCFVSESTGKVYGVVPNWSDPKTGPKADFGLYDRLVGYAQPFDEDGNVTPLAPDAAQIDFLRAIHRYGSKLDVTLYRKDWQFLLRLPETQRRRVAEEAARQALRLIDTPLRRLDTRWEDRVPGLAGESHVGDGITLFLDQPPPPGDARYAAFDDFRNRLVHALIAEMRQRHRHYTLNLMIQAADLVPALRQGDEPATATAPKAPPPAAAARGRASAPPAPPADPPSATWTFDGLLDYLVRAEDPPFQDGRIAVGTGGYRSHTNVTVRYLVALPEPTTLSKKTLREAVESTPALAGTNRAILLRRILPLVSVGSSQPQQMSDDMAYFNDNFGGVALWPQPVADATFTHLVETTLRSTILAGETREGALCNLVCDWRWALRAAFWLLLGIVAVSLAALLLSCRVRALGRPYQLYVVVAGIVPLVIGGLLLRCDPDLASANFSNQLLFAVLAVVIVALLVPLLKPKVQRP